jgi:NAD(P)H-hydrate repair Nnr-like enzyme with NAD(P)H-hydrate dehydratase domain
MNLATFLRYAANVGMGAILVKLVAGDIAADMRHSPYHVAGAAAAMGAMAGTLLTKRQHRRARHRAGQCGL